jgi:hypothetical protein
VLEGQPATIYIRTERQVGGNTYSTDGDTSRFSVRVDPVP